MNAPHPHPLAAPFSVCAQCGELVVPQDKITYFDIFQLSPQYFIDLKLLQNRFYELSRVLHPDRFQTHSTENMIKATEWFAFLNTAFETLRTPDERARYILSLAPITLSEEKSSLPPALAEEYFDLQDALETSDDKKELVKNFSQHLQAEMTKATKIQDEAFKEWEEKSKPLNEEARASFQVVSKALQLKSYLASMTHDLEKKWH